MPCSTRLLSMICSLGLLACAEVKKASTSASAPAVAKASHAHGSGGGDARFELTKTSTPLFFPTYKKECRKSKELMAVMKGQFSPAFNTISANIFHSSAPEEERMDAIADAAAIILGCVDHVQKLRPDVTDKEWLAFDHFLRALMVDMSALQIAALESDSADLRHWYGHVKSSCASCHAHFWDPE